jgi:MFS family permease
MWTSTGATCGGTSKMKTKTVPVGTILQTDLPCRLDRLPWSSWHWLITLGLGITWMLDGLEVTMVGSLGSVLGEKSTLYLTEAQIGVTGSAYLAGAVIGALFFGWLTDRLGRKRLFFITLAVYLAATLLTAFSWNFLSFLVFRFFTGMGIGGEYSAINSAVDELIPARVRGRIDLGINSSYWAGTALGAGMSLVLLNPNLLPHSIGWRLCFGIGAVLGIGILFARRYLDESPRWLLQHGRVGEAEKIVKSIEAKVRRSIKGELPLSPPPHAITVKGHASLKDILHIFYKKHPRRSILGLALMISQAFAYNAIFFTYALVLSRFYGVPASSVGYYILPFAIGNLIGPLILGSLFDTIGRRKMIVATYGIAGILLAITGFGFSQGWLTATTQTALWCAVFFVASAAASSAYLTVSELFPVEIRGMAIAVFYSVGTGIGGVVAPALLGRLIQSGNRVDVAIGYYIGAGLLILAATVAAVLAVSAEGKSLEEIAELDDCKTSANIADFRKNGFQPL